MYVKLVPEPSSDVELRALHDWLREEAALQGRVQLERAMPADGELGPTWESVVVAVLSATSGSLGGALAAYLKYRPTVAKVDARVKGKDGEERSVIVTAGNGEDAAALLKEAIVSMRQEPEPRHDD